MYRNTCVLPSDLWINSVYITIIYKYNKKSCGVSCSTDKLRDYMTEIFESEKNLFHLFHKCQKIISFILREYQNPSESNPNDSFLNLSPRR